MYVSSRSFYPRCFSWRTLVVLKDRLATRYRCRFRALENECPGQTYSTLSRRSDGSLCTQSAFTAHWIRPYFMSKAKKQLSDTQFLKYDTLLINIHVLRQQEVQKALPYQTSHLAASRVKWFFIHPNLSQLFVSLETSNVRFERKSSNQCSLADYFMCWLFKRIKKESRNRPGVAQRVPGGLGSKISWHSAHEGGEVVSLAHRPPLPPGIFLVFIFTRGRVDFRAMVRSEGNTCMSLKNPVTPPEIDAGTVRLVDH
jgi:hypothetical protein